MWSSSNQWSLHSSQYSIEKFISSFDLAVHLVLIFFLGMFPFTHEWPQSVFSRALLELDEDAGLLNRNPQSPVYNCSFKAHRVTAHILSRLHTRMHTPSHRMSNVKQRGTLLWGMWQWIRKSKTTIILRKKWWGSGWAQAVTSVLGAVSVNILRVFGTPSPTSESERTSGRPLRGSRNILPADFWLFHNISDGSFPHAALHNPVTRRNIFRR